MAPRILVVDDNQELLSLLTQLFEDAGYEVSAASRGKQASRADSGAASSLTDLSM